MNEVSVHVWALMACFSRPEMNVERTTYPIITVSAAKGLLQAIYFKLSEFRWRITSLELLSPIQTMMLRTNEVKAPPNRRNLYSYYADQQHTQRYTMALRKPAYVIRATPVLVGKSPQNNITKHCKIFERRVRKGACFYRPYMGMRDFPAYFGPVDNAPRPIDLTEDLGPMPLSVRHTDDNTRVVVQMFNARMEHGVVRVPQEVQP